MNRKKLLAVSLGVLTLALAACGGGDDAAPTTTAPTTNAPTVEKTAPTTAAPTTTQVPTTTQQPTTTQAPPVTAPSISDDDAFRAAFHDRFGEQMSRTGDDMITFGHAAIDHDVARAITVADQVHRSFLDMQTGAVDLPGVTGTVGNADIFAFATCAVAYRDAHDAFESLDVEQLQAAKGRLQGCNEALGRVLDLNGQA